TTAKGARTPQEARAIDVPIRAARMVSAALMARATGATGLRTLAGMPAQADVAEATTGRGPSGRTARVTMRGRAHVAAPRAHVLHGVTAAKARTGRRSPSPRGVPEG